MEMSTSQQGLTKCQVAGVSDQRLRK